MSVEQGYEKKEGEVNRTSFDPSREEDIRDLFREMVIDVFGNYLNPSEMREEDLKNTELSDITGVSDKSIKRLKDHGYESIEDVRVATVEELQEIKGIGEKMAKRLVNA